MQSRVSYEGHELVIDFKRGPLRCVGELWDRMTVNGVAGLYYMGNVWCWNRGDRGDRMYETLRDGAISMLRGEIVSPMPRPWS